MRFKSILSALLLFGAGTASAAEAPSVGAAGSFALVEATVVDVEGGVAIPNAVVLINAGKITMVGPAASVAVPADAIRISLSGRWLLPGLMDMHVHLSPALDGSSAHESDGDRLLRMTANARKALSCGVTTLRLVGEIGGSDFDLRRAIERGLVPGPRIFTTGPIITTTGGHGHMAERIDGPYGLSQLAREQISKGADWIKISISGGIGNVRGDINSASMTDEELSTLIETSHRMGVKVTAHNASNEAAAQAMKFGIDGFEHGYNFSESTLREMKAKGIWLVPTVAITQPGIEDFNARNKLPAVFLQRLMAVRSVHWHMLQSAIQIGVPIALGTDQIPCETNSGTSAAIRETELYVEAGMTPAAALRAATIQPARLLGVDSYLGQIKQGYMADIIAVAGDPLKDIRALRTIEFIMKGGQVFHNIQTD